MGYKRLPETIRPENRFEERHGRGEHCEGCNSHYTRQTHDGASFLCRKCEAYMATFNLLSQSYAELLETWRDKFGLSREGALDHAQEFAGLNEDLKDFLMDGYSMREYEELSARLHSEDPKVLAAPGSSLWLAAA